LKSKQPAAHRSSPVGAPADAPMESSNVPG
jgi:hypothetical protein